MIQVNVVALAALTRLFLLGFVMYLGNAIAEEISDTSVTVTTLLPGATASEFAKTAGMDKTSLFNQTTPAADVALTGYEAMLRGDLNVFAGVTRKRKIMMWIAPLLPRRYVLKSVREMQEAQPA